MPQAISTLQMEYWKTLTVRPDLMKERVDSSLPDQKEREDSSRLDQKEREDRLKKMEELNDSYKYAMNGECERLKEDLEKNREKLLYKMTVDGDTVFHLAASLSSKYPQAREVLQMVISKLNSTNDKIKALRVPNKYGNNTLHEVSVSGNKEAAEYLVNNFNEPLPEEVKISTSSTDKDKRWKARDSENYALQLLETRNYLGETPLFRAAALGHTDLVKFYAGKLPEENLWRHFHRDDKMSLLHITVIVEHFETALWLLEKYPYLALLKEDKGLTSLQLLAQMPTAFEHQFEQSKWKMLIYKCLPVGGDVVAPNQKDDVESSMDSNHPRQSIFRNNLAVVMKAYYSLWDSLAKVGTQDRIIYRIWKTKKNKKSLNELIRLLVKREDYSWLTTDKEWEVEIRTINLGSGEKPEPNKDGDDGGKKGKPAAEEIESRKEARNEVYNSSPLLIATIKGIVPIVREILEQRPQAVEHVNLYERNILHLAIKNRKEKILDLIKSKPTLMSKLNERIDLNGNTILHQAADRTYYSIAVSQKLIGPAMQLQEELRWMLRIKEIVPPHYIMHHNNNNQTAEEFFNVEHEKLLKSAQKWVKETAQSCSTVAVLVATVVFAAAYAIPGGFNDESGRPIFQDNPLFLLFTCMDVVSITCSLSSVAFFLSVLSSPLEYPHFVSSIPTKIMTGFILLFFSMATTMLAFAATILLLIRVKKKWTESLLYPIAFFPVPFFALLQFPMYQSLITMVQKIHAWFEKPICGFLGLRNKRSGSIWGKKKVY
ncbi:uncharacterized protein [Malus domestica]|uniref:uncharacterized protein n=1 Tax=Malus domestica TaxID=3750 RepID=UPI0004989C9E